MAEGTGVSDDERKARHGHIPSESIVFKILRSIMAPLGLLQPDDGYVRLPPEKPRDPLEDTPEEEERELERERMGGTPQS